MEQVIVAVILLVASALLMPKPKTQSPQPGEPGNVPTAKEGAPIGVIFGKPVITGHNCTWYGDLRADPIRKSGGKK